jgi:hypothetical protein
MQWEGDYVLGPFYEFVDVHVWCKPVLKPGMAWFCLRQYQIHFNVTTALPKQHCPNQHCPNQTLFYNPSLSITNCKNGHALLAP